MQAAACDYGLTDLKRWSYLPYYAEIERAAPHANACAARFDRIDAPAVFGKSSRKPVKFLLLCSGQHGGMQTERAEERARKHG